MTLAVRSSLAALLLLSLSGWGCNEATTTTSTSVQETPPAVLEPTAPDEAKGAPARTSPEPASTAVAKPANDQTEPAKAVAETPKPAAEPAAGEAAQGESEKKDEPPASETPKEASAADKAKTAAADVALVPVKFNEMLEKIAAKKAKLTMVDAWATWCGPCKENFPHVVEMHHKYSGQGLNVVSLSLDDPSDSKAKSEALKFLQEKNASFTNFLLDEETDVGFDKLNVSSIPAVFLYGPDGKEVKRFTGDDPNNQFTYDQVEKTVAAMLQGTELPK